MVLARKMKTRWNTEIKNALAENRLLIISPFTKEKRVVRKTAKIRNEYILKISDKIVAANTTPGGQLDTLLKKNQNIVKTVYLTEKNNV